MFWKSSGVSRFLKFNLNKEKKNRQFLSPLGCKIRYSIVYCTGKSEERICILVNIFISFTLWFFFFGTLLFSQFIHFCLLCQMVIFHGHDCRRYNSDYFVSLWVFWSSFTIKSINACVDRCCDCTTVNKDLSTFYLVSTVWFNEIYLNNIV